MKKVVTTHLQSVVFSIEEDAFAKLEKYLDSVRKYFKNFEDADDIVSDIELRIAEKFTTEVISTKHKVINKTDVEALIASMGSVADIASESDEPVQEKEHAVKRLYRNSDDIVVSGLASGIAAYVGIDPVIVRGVFILSMFFGGFGLLLYLVLWAITPLAQTPTQKLEMKGSPLTLSSVEENLSETLEAASKNSSGFRQLIQTIVRPFTFIALALFRFARAFFWIFLKGLGLLLVISTFFGLGMATIGAGTFSMNLHLQYFEPAVSELFAIIPNHLYQLLIWSGYVSSLIPLFLVSLLGIAFLSGRNFLTAKVVLPLIGIMIMTGTVATLTMIKIMPDVMTKAEQLESEKQQLISTELTEKEFELKDFSGVRFDQDTHIILTAADEFKVVVTGPSEQLDTFNLRVENGILTNDPRVHANTDEKICVFACNSPMITVAVSLPELSSVEVSDISRLESDTLFVSPEIELIVQDAAQASLNLQSQQTKIQTSGIARLNVTGSFGQLSLQTDDNSKVEMNGDGTEATIRMTGISWVEINGGFDWLKAFLTDNSRLIGPEVLKAVIEASDIASVRLKVLEELEATTEGNSSVRYSGSPTTKINEHDISTVEAIE